MGDPIWLDNNTVDLALKGDPSINEQLSNYRRAGRKLLMPPAAAQELLDGNVFTMERGNRKHKPVWEKAPTARSRAAMKMGMNRLGIEVDTSGNKIPMSRRVDYKLQRIENISESDRIILGDIKAGAESRSISKPQMITDERRNKAMMAESHHWGIESIPTAKSRGTAPEPPRVILADYPRDDNGPISRFFKDRPILAKLGLIGAGIAAQNIHDAMLSMLEDHFNNALRDARKDFDMRFPNPDRLKAQANLDRFRVAYESALKKLRAPSNAKVAEAVILAFTKYNEIDEIKKKLDDMITKISSAASGELVGYSKASDEYIDAMVGLYKKINESQLSGDLVKISMDIEERAMLISNIGDALENEFWKNLPYVAAFPFAQLIWADVHNVALTFNGIGAGLKSFSGEIATRARAYASIQKQLDQELIKVSDELSKH